MGSDRETISDEQLLLREPLGFGKGCPLKQDEQANASRNAALQAYRDNGHLTLDGELGTSLAARGSSLEFEIAVSEYSRCDLSIPADLRADSGFQNLPEALNNSN